MRFRMPCPRWAQDELDRYRIAACEAAVAVCKGNPDEAVHILGYPELLAMRDFQTMCQERADRAREQAAASLPRNEDGYEL